MTDSTPGVRSGGAVTNEDWDAAQAAWRKSVAGVLARGRRVEPDTLGDTPEQLLVHTTYDGVEVQPLYTPADELPEDPLPGVFPFERGVDPVRDVTTGWHVSARYGDEPGSPAELNEQILGELERGVTALWLAVGEDAIAPADLAAVLDGVLPDLAPITLDAGPDLAEAVAALDAFVAGAAVADRAAVQICLGAAPLTDAMRAGAAAKVPAELIELAAASAARTETVRTFVVDGTAFHDRGGSDAEELAGAIAAGVAYVRALVAAGMSAADALGQIEFRLAATDDQFQTIAKLRAGRLLWARVAEVLGAPEAGAAPQHAVTSAAMMTRRDPWVNMLRTTLAGFGAGVGGAEAVTVLEFDAALPTGALGTSQSFARRIARNTQLLLLEESNLGRVIDPGGGSWYIETLTDQVAETAWALFQRIEGLGGFTEAEAVALLSDRIAETAARREGDIAHRRTALTGINEFPNLAEPVPAAGAERLSDVARYAAGFEALRDRSDAHLADTGARPGAVLVALGPLAEHNVRTSFATNLLASGGIEATATDTVTAESVGAALTELGAPTTVTVVCGTDKRYADEAAATIAALRAAGAGQVWLAGPEKAYPADAEARPDGFLTMTIDAVETLTGMLDTLGVK